LAVKVAKIVVIVILLSALVNFAREGRTFHLIHVLPFVGGHEPGLYDVAGLVLLWMGFGWGLARIRRNQRRD
jgi:hypothetical protein